MSNYTISSVLIFLSLLFVACGSQKKAVIAEQKALPSWYTSVAPTSATELYALGEGRNKEEALAQALSNMASTLSVSVSSDFRAKTVVKEGAKSSVDATYESDLKSRVEELRISNYEIVNAASLGFKKYAVLIKSNKNKLFESMLAESRQELTLLEKREKNLANANAIKKIAFYQEAQKSLANLPNRLIVMRSLRSDFDGSSYLEQMQGYEMKLDRLLGSVSFVVHSSNNIANLKSVIEKGLSQKSFKVAKVLGANTLSVTVSASIQRADAYGFTLARSEIEFVTKDSSANIIATNRVNLTGQSSQGYEVAKQNLAFVLDELVQKEGISSVLGLGI